MSGSCHFNSFFSELSLEIINDWVYLLTDQEFIVFDINKREIILTLKPETKNKSWSENSMGLVKPKFHTDGNQLIIKDELTITFDLSFRAYYHIFDFRPFNPPVSFKDKIIQDLFNTCRKI